MQDFTGVPCIVDLAAMREAIVRLGGDPQRVNPLAPAELVIDHSVQVDEYGAADSLQHNNEIEFKRNGERYMFLRWGQTAFSNFKVVPPNTGIVHQVNIEHLARVIFSADGAGKKLAYPDTLVGTDSHTTMVNGLGVLGWGVGGIEAEAAMLGQPVTMLIPQVIGFKLTGSLPAGTTATDLVLTVTEMLRKVGVVDKFVEFFGDGLKGLPLADRATIANMSPEFGSTCAIFPIDEETIRYLALTGRTSDQIALVEAYAKAQGLWRINGAPAADYTQVVELDLSTVEPSLAGPKRPQDRVPLRKAKSVYQSSVKKMADERAQKNPQARGVASATVGGTRFRGQGRRGIDRRHHQLHQHLEPRRVGRRRFAGAQCGRARPQVQALGQDLPGAGFARRDRLPAQGRVIERPGGARVLHRGLRMHHLHRQLRPLEAGNFRSRQERRCRRLLGAVRQSKFRGPRASGNQNEFPRLPAAGGRLRARGKLGHRHHHRAPGTGQRRQTGVPEGDLAERNGRGGGGGRVGGLGDVQQGVRQRIFRRCELERDQDARGQDLFLGRPIHLRQEPAVLRRHHHDAGAGGRYQGRTRAGSAGRFGHHRSYFARRQHFQVQSGGQVPAVAGRASRGFQFLRRTPRQPRGDDARHLCQHQAAQSVAAGHGGRRDAAHTQRRTNVHFRCRNEVQDPGHSSRSFLPARNTAPAARATGPPKARCCWGRRP